MSTAQLINIIVLIKCCLILPLKVFAQTYSSYGNYVSLQYSSHYEGAKSPYPVLSKSTMMTYGSPALYGFYSASSPIRFMPDIPFQHLNIVGDYWGETLEQGGATNMQQPVLENTAASNSSDNSDIEGSIHIPHKPKYIDEEETEQIESTTTSGSEVLTQLEIVGIVIGGLYLVMLILGMAGALYIYFVRRNNPDLSQVLLF